jgi:hypothetical protein
MDLGGTGSPAAHVHPHPQVQAHAQDQNQAHAPTPCGIAPVRRYAGLVVGVVDHAARAEDALATFRHHGFDGDQIGLARCSGALFVQENALARADAADRGLTTALCALGVPELEAGQYQRELERGRSIVTVQAAGRARYAASVLQRAVT